MVQRNIFQTNEWLQFSGGSKLGIYNAMAHEWLFIIYDKSGFGRENDNDITLKKNRHSLWTLD